MQLSPHHPFRSAEARERFLRAYDTRAAEWPVDSDCRTVETAYGPTLVRMSGPPAAPPLVLLHGISNNSLMWAPNIGALSRSYRTYAPDNVYDFGRSVYTRDMQGPEDMVRWLDEILRRLEPGRPVRLAGISYGGWLAARYALSHPDRLEKLVLLAPVATVLPLPFQWIVRGLLCMVPHPFFTRSLLLWLAADLAARDASGRAMVERLAEDGFLAIRCFAPKRMIVPNVLSDSELAGIRVPTLFLIGEHEKLCSARGAIERLRAVAPAIRTELIPGAGHDLMIVRADEVQDRILSFLAG